MGHVIIGNSAAGIYAAETIRDVDRDCRITIISDEDCPCYSRCLLPYYLSGELSRERLLIRDSLWYEGRDIETLFGRRAVRITHKERRVVLDDGEEVPYDSLLIATGGSPRFPNLDGIDSSMVFSLRTLDDVLKIEEVVPKVKQAVILGAGLIGLKAAYALWRRGIGVTVVEMLGHILPQMLDLQAAEIVEKIVKERNIIVKTNATATEIVRRRDRLESIRLDDGETIECDLLICAVGVKPNTELVEDTDIEIGEGIWVDHHMRTNVPGIYAAGDVAETIDFLSKERRINAIWPSAAKEGRIAGYNMAGVEKRCDAEVAMNSLDFFDIPVVSIGLIDPEGEEYEMIATSSPNENVYKKLVLKDGKIVGLLFVGDVAKAGVLLSLIKREDDVSQIKSAFLEGEVFRYSPVTAAFRRGLHYPVAK